MLRKLLVWTVTAMSLLGVPAASQADDYDDQSESWVPSISFAVSVHDEKYDLVGDNNINFQVDESKSRTMAALRFGAEVMSPALENLRAKPRIFGYAGLLWSTPGDGLNADKSNTVSVDDWQDVNLGSLVRTWRRQKFSDPSRTRTVDDFEGQGNRVSGRQLHNAWFLGVGAAYSFPFSGFTIRLRPSVEYVGERIRTIGEYALLTEPFDDDIFVINAGDVQETDIQHSLGPAFEIEFLNHLDSNVTLAFFAQTRFLWILNDTKVSLTDKAVDGSEIYFSSKRDRFNFRGGVGFRFGFRNLAFQFK